MFGLFESVFDLATNVTQVILAPVEGVLVVANAAVKPLADGAKELVKDTKDLLKD